MNYKDLNKIQKDRMKQISVHDYIMEWENPEFMDYLLGSLPQIRRMKDDVKCTLCQGHYDFFLFRFLFYICLLCRGIKVMPLIDCFHLLLQGLSEDKFLLSYIDNTQQVTTLLSPIDNVLYYSILSNP